MNDLFGGPNPDGAKRETRGLSDEDSRADTEELFVAPTAGSGRRGDTPLDRFGFGAPRPTASRPRAHPRLLSVSTPIVLAVALALALGGGLGVVALSNAGDSREQ